MSDSPDSNVITFRRDVPASRIKRPEGNAKRQCCQHRQVEIWACEPVLECRDCGAMVDPYDWIRTLTHEWGDVERQHAYRKREAEREMAEIEKKLRALRGEFRDETERREASRAIAVLPARKGLGA